MVTKLCVLMIDLVNKWKYTKVIMQFTGLLKTCFKYVEKL